MNPTLDDFARQLGYRMAESADRQISEALGFPSDYPRPDDSEPLTWERVMQALHEAYPHLVRPGETITQYFHRHSGGRNYIPMDDGFLALCDGQVVRYEDTKVTHPSFHYSWERK